MNPLHKKALSQPEPACPNCNALLKVVGFKTFEQAQVVFDWQYEEKSKQFFSHQKEVVHNDGEIEAECGSCKGELSFDELAEAGLV